MGNERASRRGIVLILVSGVLTLLAVLGGLLVQASRMGSAAAETVAQETLARIAAASALDYAGSRLWQDRLSLSDRDVAWTPVNACDDWAARGGETDGTPRTENPSWSRGESWEDSGLPGDTPGAYDAGIDNLSAFSGGWTDKDGDGRFSAWTGRLRGGAATARFSLRSRAAGGLVCVNGGELRSPLGDHDLDGELNEDDGNFATDVPANAHRDPDYVGNLHLVNLLNNLGAILALSDTHDELYAPAANPPSAIAALENVTISNLGRRIVEGRPAGGYATLSGVAAALAPFYPAAEIEKVLPYLTTSGEITPVPFEADPADFSGDKWWSLVPAPEIRYEFQARTDFNAAPPEVIRASLRYAAHSGSGGASGIVPDFVRILPDEADAMAGALAAARPVRTWKKLLETLVANRSLWITDPIYAAHPNADKQPRHKEDLVLALWNANRFGPERFFWGPNSLEVPREVPPGVGADETTVQLAFRTGLARTHNTHPVSFPMGPLEIPAGNLPARPTPPFTLSPLRSDFDVAAEGWTSGDGTARGSARIEGLFSRNERSVLLTGQQDFEPVLGVGPNLPRKSWPGGEVFIDGSLPAGEWAAIRNGTQTWPRFPFSRFDGTVAVTNFPAASFGDPDDYRLTRAVGSVSLSSRQWDDAELLAGTGIDAGEIALALPYNEDPGIDAAANAHWLDNIWDPAYATRAIPPTVSQTIEGLFVEDGIKLSPAGPRALGGTHETIWNCGTAFGDGIFQADAAGFTGGTIVAWVPTGLGQDHSALAPSASQLDLRFFDGAWRSYVGLTVPDGARSAILRKGNFPPTPFTRTFNQPAVAPASELAATGWRCVAVTFERPGADTLAYLHIDGVKDGTPLVLSLTASYAGDPRMRLVLSGSAQPCDVVFFKRTLTQEEILKLATKPMYETTGEYVSPRLSFDATRLPRGAILTGFSWDGFIPASANGSVTLTLTGFDAADAPLGTLEASWTAGATGALSFGGPPIPGCRAARIKATLAVDPAPVTLHDATGAVLAADVRVVRDAPVIEELRIFYTDGKPRWTPR